jgi:hypothetical protein
VIENLVDQAIVSLLQTLPGLNVVPGLSNDVPALTTPYAVVFSEVVNRDGRDPVFELKTTVKLETVSGQTEIADVQSWMTAIDSVLSTQPSDALMHSLVTQGLKFIGWDGIPRTVQDVGERRQNIRELQVFAALA